MFQEEEVKVREGVLKLDLLYHTDRIINFDEKNKLYSLNSLIKFSGGLIQKLRFSSPKWPASPKVND